ncbi:5'-nucleotidase [Curtobacterium flaccumfaciens]|uniref:5'-nucleotidase n=1 Tax=Curtobacterium flaccumfaciens TaxID=2035 RepID=UPI0037C08850
MAEQSSLADAPRWISGPAAARKIRALGTTSGILKAIPPAITCCRSRHHRSKTLKCFRRTSSRRISFLGTSLPHRGSSNGGRGASSTSFQPGRRHQRWGFDAVRTQQQVGCGRSVQRTFRRRVHVAIVTARNAPSHERVVTTLKSWGLRVNDAFLLGGVEKARILRVLRPHIFFDDQLGHLEGAANEVPSVHVPFGVVNEVPA